MFRLLLSFLFLISVDVTPHAFAQSLEGGARSVALGGATTALAGDIWGHANPAVWSTQENRALSFFASQAFGLPELRLGALHAIQPLSFGTFALGVRSFGYEAFRTTHLNLGLARAFTLGTSRAFHVGLSATYQMVSIERYGSGGALGLTVGTLVGLSPSLDLGFQATNINRPQLAGREEFPRTIALGLGYRPAEAMTIVVDANKDIRFPLSLRAGFEFLPIPTIAIRAGITTEPNRFTSGIGLRLSRVITDIAAERHPWLGWSPAFALSLLL